MQGIMGPWTRRFAVGLSLVLLAGCTRSSPTAPAAPAAPPPAVAAAAVFLAPNSWDMPAGGGSLLLDIATSASTAGNVVAPDIEVELSASSGTLSDTRSRTDRTGHAKVTWTGTSSATITARAGDVVGTAAIRVPSPPPTAPPPNPNPVPSPAPSPAPEPTPGLLVVTIFPSPRGGDAVTPIAFFAQVRAADNRQLGPLTYAWDFESDGIVDSTETAPTHLFRPADHWTVSLRVTAPDGGTGVGRVDVVIGATPAPVVTTTLRANPTTAVIGARFTFTATGSGNSTSGPVTAFDWDFDTSTPGLDLTTSTGSATTSYETPGVRTVRVTARTANGSSGNATADVTVTAPLTVSLEVSPAGTQPAGRALSITATVTSAGPVPGGLVFEWDWTNDGTFDDEPTTGSPTSTVGHVYNSNTPATKTLRVKVTAPDNRTATNTITITVS